ncbi:hypothetical protein H6G25_19255, partial [Dolichospermum sp. FACHB-1091]|nr:hypothetical protein [Dolichospermum sp. FACHB-1091]
MSGHRFYTEDDLLITQGLKPVNWGLATWASLHKDRLKPNKYILKKFFNNHVKPELAWIKEKGICQKITQYAF